MKLAVLIAVEKYSDLRIRPAPFAEADATALAAVLEPQGFSAIDRVMLVNDQATKSSIESRIKRIRKKLGPDDEVHFFFAGHGFSKSGANFIACYDTDPEDLPDTSIQFTWLWKQFQDSPCKQFAFFLDSRPRGLPTGDDALDLHAPFDDAALKDVVLSSPRSACFAACQTNESSLASGALQHGIWAFHLIEAFDGKASTALVKGALLTSASLQGYLRREVPRTLTKTFATKAVQSPWMVGGSDGELVLADLTDLLAARQAAAHPHSGQIKNVALLVERSKGVRSLSGFNKGHQQPERINSAAEAFVAKISSEEITSDVNGVFAALKSAFGFKRADLHTTNQGDGTATIITPFFNYSITVALDQNDASQAIFRKTVDAIKSPERIYSDEFAKVFDDVFDTVEFDTPSPVDLASLIDRLEERNDGRITIDYDPEATYCRVRIGGVAGAITVTSHSLSIVHTKPESPQRLLQSFFAIQKALVDQHDVGLIPFDG